RPDRPRRHPLLRAEPVEGVAAGGLGDGRGGEEGRDRGDRRLDRFTLGAAARQLRERGRERAEDNGEQVSTRMAQAAKLPLTNAAEKDRRRLRVHGSSWLCLGGGVAFVIVSVLVGVIVGPAPIGIGAI